MSRWHEGLGDAVVEVDCRGERHRVRWHRGHLQLEHHPDRLAEEVLAALGGDGEGRSSDCLHVLDLWRLAVRDGGFLTEWARREEPDPARRGRHQVALVRLRREGVQDLLPDLEIRRAERMGTVLAHFPPELVERAALAAVQRLQRRADFRHHELTPWLAHAVRVRARSAFVRSLHTWRHRARPAALVPFTCRVVVGGGLDSGGRIEPAVVGRLDGRASWCEVTVSTGWLLDVWARGVAVVGGDLVLAAEPVATDQWKVRAVEWSADQPDQPLAPRLVDRLVPHPHPHAHPPPAPAGGRAGQTAISSRTRESSSAPVSPLSTTRPASSTA